MANFHQLREEFEVKQSALFKEYGVFFAFSQKQFDEQRKEGVRYVSAEFGMILPKDKVDAFMDAHQKLIEENQARHKAEVDMDEYILYELYNHESFYTGRTSDALRAVWANFPDCTQEDVSRVYRSYVERKRKERMESKKETDNE